MKTHLRHLYFLPLLFLLAGIGIFKACQSPFKLSTKNKIGFEKMKGVCWEALWDSVRVNDVQSLNDHGVEWISQTPFAWQSGVNSPELKFRSDKKRNRSRDTSLVEMATMARKKGIKTLLKPHIWITEANGKWRSDIDMNSPEEWDQWFERYEAFIMHYAQIAATHNFEGLCIGTELYIASTQHEQRWRNIIANIRKIYPGQLTYAANFYKEYEEIAFWDALDYIGIQGYFPLTQNEKPSLKELKKGWEPHVQKIKEVQARWDMPIVFTEIGYKSSTDSAISPWEWEKRGEDVDPQEICDTTQAICYQAVFEMFWKEEWIGGFFIWKWTSEIYRNPTDTSARRRRRGHSPLSFTPKKPALEIIKEWYVDHRRPMKK